MRHAESPPVARDRGPVYRPVAELARRIEPSRNDRPVHPSTVVRWITKGVRLQGGVVLKLKALRFPGHWAVSDEDFAEFIDVLTRDRSGESTRPEATTSARRERDLARVDAQLESIGI